MIDQQQHYNSVCKVRGALQRNQPEERNSSIFHILSRLLLTPRPRLCSLLEGDILLCMVYPQSVLHSPRMTEFLPANHHLSGCLKNGSRQN